LARNTEKIHQKLNNSQKNAKFGEEIQKNGNSIIQSRKNVDDFWLN